MSTPGVDDAPVMLRQIAYTVGSRVRVRSVSGGYPLPDGLPEGAQVVVVEIEPGSRVVEFEGRHFTVPQACVNSGFQVIPESRHPGNAR
jgi:hypothetical protein